MKKSRYSDEQIVRILREADSAPIAEVAKRHGVSDASIYAWRKRFGEMVGDDGFPRLASDNCEARDIVVRLREGGSVVVGRAYRLFLATFDERANQ